MRDKVLDSSIFLERLSFEKKRLLLFVALAILTTGILVGASISYSSYLSAKQYLTQVYTTTAKSHGQAIENEWYRLSSIASQFTSRTEIRKKLEAYHRNEISLAELQEYSQPRLEEPASHVDDLAAMFRLHSNGEIVAIIGDKGDELDDQVRSENHGLQMVCHVSSIQPYIKVIAPIYSQEKEEIGQDILYFYPNSLKPLLEQFATFAGNSQLYIANSHTQRALTLDEYDQIKPHTLTETQLGLISHQISVTDYSENGIEVTSIYIPFEQIDGWGLLITVPQHIFYQTANQDLNGSIWSVITLLIVGLLLANMFINPLINRLVKQTEQIETNAIELRLAASVFNKSNESLIITDKDFNIERISPGFARTFSIDTNEVIEHNLFEYMLNDTQHPNSLISLEAAQAHLEEHEAWHGEVWYQYKGRILPILQNISLVRSDDGQAAYYIHSFNEISEQKHHEQEMHKLAHFDTLTGLPNRLSLQGHIERMVKESDPQQDQFALLFIDLDKFKPVNDTYGHQMGDKLLIEVAQRINQLKHKPTDMSGRLAGDEFLLILNSTHLEATNYAEQIADQLVQSLSTPFIIDDIELTIGASIGIACYPQHGIESVHLIEAADQAMYYAKNNGRNQFYKAP